MKRKSFWQIILCLFTVLAIACSPLLACTPTQKTFTGVELKDVTVAYTGDKYSLEVEGLPHGATVTYTYNGEDVDGVRAQGEYEVVAVITKDGYKTKTLTANIQKPQGVNINRKSVSLTIPVEMCTEKEIKVPISIENLPRNINIRTFPNEVKIRFSVGLSHYNSVTEKTFSAILDYNDIILNPDKSTATLQLDYTSGYIFNIQLNPSEVEYIIEN